MSENNKEFDIAPQEDLNLEQNQNSTLFTDPNQFYIDEKTPYKKSLLKTALIALAAVVLVIGAGVAVKFLVPDKEQTVTSSNSKTSIAVTEYSSDDVEKFTLTTKDYTTVLYSNIEQAEDNTSAIKWYVEGVDGSLTDSFGIGTAVNSAVALKAVRKMDANQVDFGFEEPMAKIEIKSRNEKFENYTITIGDVAPDRSGYYVKLSIKDDVYLVSTDDIEAFNKDIYAFANLTLISAFQPGDAPDEYFSEETLLKVDEINLHGNYYNANMSFRLNTDENTAPFMTYVMTAPYKRYAENEVMKLVASPFINGIYAERCYTYDATAKDTEEYGLDDPNIVLTLKVGNVQHTIKATRNYDGYFAVMIDNNPAIYQVTRSYLDFYDRYYVTNYISPVVFSEMLKNFTDIDVTVDGKTYDFNIDVVESEEEEDVYNVTAGSTPIKAENFQNYYAQLLGMTITEISVKKPDVAPSMTVVLTRKNRTRARIEFAQTADRRYHVSVDGEASGYISATTYEKLKEYTTLAYEGKDVISVTKG